MVQPGSSHSQSATSLHSLKLASQLSQQASHIPTYTALSQPATSLYSLKPASHILTQPQASQPATSLHSLKPANSHSQLASQPHPYTASRQPARSLHSLKLLFHKLCVLELCERNAPPPNPPCLAAFLSHYTYICN